MAQGESAIMPTNLTYLAGLALCALAGFQAIVFLLRSLGGWNADRRANALRVELLTAEIEAARSRHQIEKQSTSGWEGYRKFRVDRIVNECDGVHSFYLVPHDGKIIPSFTPGQYLTFQLRIPGATKPVVRCYSLSDAPGRNYYRCTIKKAMRPPDMPDAPDGRASTYLNEQVTEGDILDIKSPRGTFVLNAASDRPIVLIAAGVGMTPMLSMMNTIALLGSKQKVTFFYGVRNSLSHIARGEISALCDSHSNLNVVTCFSNPLPTDVCGRHYDVHARVSISLLRERLGPDAQRAYDFYICGPGAFMNEIVQGLKTWGVASTSIHTESFGPSSVRRASKSLPLKSPLQSNGDQPAVAFTRSKKQLAWNPEWDSLLDLAEAAGVEVESGCRAGNCGTCALAVKNGTVTYTEEPNFECETGTCLPCICVPDGPLELDA